MEAPTKEEVLEMARSIANQVIAAVREDRLTYHEPASVKEGLQASMGEELQASMWYQLRAKHAADHGDHKAANLYNHIASEENRHYEQFNKRLIELSGG